MVQHSHQSRDTAVSMDNFRIIKNGFENQKMKRKVSEALPIKKYKQPLKKQVNLFSLFDLINQRRILRALSNIRDVFFVWKYLTETANKWSN